MGVLGGGQEKGHVTWAMQSSLVGLPHKSHLGLNHSFNTLLLSIHPLSARHGMTHLLMPRLIPAHLR